MPAHAQVHARTIGLATEGPQARTPPTRSNASQRKAAKPRAATVAGEQRVLAYIANAAAATGYRCTTLQLLAQEVGLTKEALRLRVDALRADGRLRREPCWCAQFDTPHVRFYPPAEAGAVAAASAEMAEHPAAAADSPSVQVRSAFAGWQLRQIMPAQSDTWALYRVAGAVWREPVIAWGMWDEAAAGASRTVVGPLVFGGAELEPAAASAGYVGVRIGGFRCLDGQRSFEGMPGTETR